MTFSRKKRNSATQECPYENGIICVVATRADNKDPLPDLKVKVAGPTPGDASTDPQGISQFEERVPGAYQLNVALPMPRYKDWAVLPYSKNLSVSGGRVTIADVRAYPTGTLIVEIREENGPLIQGAAQVQGTGAASLEALVNAGTHTFAKVACGTYDVSARLSAKYHNQSVTAPKVTVPESGTGVAKLVVGLRTWIEIELVGDDGTAVADEEYLIVTPEGQPLRGKTDANGRARLDGLVAGSCRISFPRLDADEWKSV